MTRQSPHLPYREQAPDPDVNKIFGDTLVDPGAAEMARSDAAMARNQATAAALKQAQAAITPDFVKEAIGSGQSGFTSQARGR
jgi:hypothetical protein